MNFEYNGHLTEKEKNNLVANEIIEKYPEIHFEQALKIASLEEKISTKKTLKMEFIRLYNILFIIQNKKKIYTKIFNDLKGVYNNYTKENGYTNSLIDKIMNEILLYNENKRENFPNISEFY